MTRKPIVHYEMFGGPYDGCFAEWLSDEPPVDGQTLTWPVNSQGVRSAYRFSAGAWRYLKSWRE